MSNNTKTTDWFEAQGGLCFECTGCGACCKRPGIVVFAKEDILRVSSWMDISAQDFCFNYLEFDGVDWFVSVTEQHPCLFLQDDKCTIHDAKPLQCASYPFWPEILESAQTWEEEKLICEGVGLGSRLSLLEIAQRLLDEAY